eukprot:SAG31_NODE_529_length_14420_cov_20.000140_6_plen_102_part_00
MHRRVPPLFVVCPAFLQSPTAAVPTAIVMRAENVSDGQNLKGQVNSGTKVKGMLDSFNVVHAVGDDGKQWQESGHGYVPQVLRAAQLNLRPRAALCAWSIL